jgi:hypothetical protein
MTRTIPPSGVPDIGTRTAKRANAATIAVRKRSDGASERGRTIRPVYAVAAFIPSPHASRIDPESAYDHPASASGVGR